MISWGPFPPQPFSEYVTPELHDEKGKQKETKLTVLFRVLKVEFELHHQVSGRVFNHLSMFAA